MASHEQKSWNDNFRVRQANTHKHLATPSFPLYLAADTPSQMRAIGLISPLAKVSERRSALEREALSWLCYSPFNNVSLRS